jgi:hypothetical protein
MLLKNSVPRKGLKLKEQATFRIKSESLDYLRAIGKTESRTVSYLINEVVEYAIEKHKAAPTGDQASLEILRLLGSKSKEVTERGANG